MQTKAILTLLLIPLLATPALAEKAEVSKVPPTVVSRVWGSHQRKAKPPAIPVDPVALRLKTLHKRMTAKDPLNDAELQELADSGDSLAAFFYARRLEDRHTPKALPAAVHYYAMASYLGRDFAMHRLIALMQSPEVSLTEAQIKNGRDALVKLARSGKTDAALGLSQMYAVGRPFPQDVMTSRQWLMQAAQAGDADAAQKLAQAAMMPADGSPPDLTAARAALGLMLASQDPGKIAMAQTLLARLDATSPTEVSQ